MKPFSAYLERKGCSRKTIARYEREVEHFLHWAASEGIKPAAVTYRDLLSYMQNSSAKGRSQRTIQHEINTIRHYYAYLKEIGSVQQNPTTGIKVKGVRRNALHYILEPEELNSLYISYPKSGPSGQRNKVIMGMVIYQGMRTTELGNMAVGDIDMQTGKVTVRETRRHNGRVLKLEIEQAKTIYDYMASIGRKSADRLFMNPNRSDNYTLMMRGAVSILKQINPKVKSLNQIRASVITKWLKQYNLREVQYRAGHRYVSSTESYRQNDIEGLQEEVEQFHPLG